MGTVDLPSLEMLKKTNRGVVGERYETDFITPDTEGRLFAPLEHDTTCVVCSANEQTPMFAHGEATGCQLGMLYSNADFARVALFNGLGCQLATSEYIVNSYGRLGKSKSENYLWAHKRSDELERDVFFPWLEATGESYTAYRVHGVGPIGCAENEQDAASSHSNDGARLRAKFMGNASCDVPNHISDLGSFTKTWVVEQAPVPCTCAKEVLLCDLLQDAQHFTNEGDAEASSLPCSTSINSADTMSPVSALSGSLSANDVADMFL